MQSALATCTKYAAFVAGGAETESEGRVRWGGSAVDQSEDDSEISNSLHGSLALVHKDLTDSPPPT